MLIGVTYDLRSEYLAQGLSEEETAEFDSDVTISAIVDALRSLGHEVVRIGGIRPLAERLVRGERFDAVFNICEGLKGVAREAQVPALLEAYDIPYVFSDPLTLCVALDKAMAKRIAKASGVATADFAVIESPSDIAKIGLPYPLFLKPVAEGSGKGVHARSLVENPVRLEEVARALLAQFRQPVLVETYLPGREFTVGIAGTGAEAEALGVLEVSLTDKAAAHGYGFENKEHFEEKIVYRPAQDEDAQAAAELALAAWRALRCRDGGRVDVRFGVDGKPYFLEVNPLAGLNPERSDLVFIARFRGMSYRDLIEAIFNAFLKRHSALAPSGA